MKHETHLSPEQTETPTQIRLPSQNENSGRPQGHSPPPPRRPEGPIRLTFSKADRLRTRREFQAIVKGKHRFVGRFLCIDKRDAKKMRLGITASSRYGNAVERNRFKRLVREAFRTSFSRLLPSQEIHVVPRQLAKNARLRDIQEEIGRLLTTQ